MENKRKVIFIILLIIFQLLLQNFILEQVQVGRPVDGHHASEDQGKVLLRLLVDPVQGLVRVLVDVHLSHRLDVEVGLQVGRAISRNVRAVIDYAKLNLLLHFYLFFFSLPFFFYFLFVFLFLGFSGLALVHVDADGGDDGVLDDSREHRAEADQRVHVKCSWISNLNKKTYK